MGTHKTRVRQAGFIPEHLRPRESQPAPAFPPSLSLTDRPFSGLVRCRERGCYRAQGAPSLVLPSHGRDGACGRSASFNAFQSRRGQKHSVHHVPVLQQGAWVCLHTKEHFVEPIQCCSVVFPCCCLSASVYLFVFVVLSVCVCLPVSLVCVCSSSSIFLSPDYPRAPGNFHAFIFPNVVNATKTNASSAM